MKDICQLQTTAPLELAVMFKVLAARRRIRLLDVYAEALHHLLQERLTLRKRGRTVQYLLPPRRGRSLNVRLPPRLGRRVADVANKDEVPVRALAYTAIVSYALSHVFPTPKPRMVAP